MKEDALFQTQLRRRVGYDVQIRNFVWSGKNRQGARLKAADQLAAHLEELTSENPDAAHLVVGHSHGGSVALYSMLKPGIAERIDGVIFLSTPFISVREHGGSVSQSSIR
jgi:triacylglycerol esterase/lipase EstA (alpha/beta hydrolase family)